MDRVFKIIDTLNEWAGKIAAYFIWVPLLVLVFETVSRYVFNSPTSWAHHVAVTSTIVVFILPGGYTLLHKGHIAVDVFTEHLSSRKRAVVDLFTSILFFAAVIAFTWHGTLYALASIKVHESSGSPLYWPLYPYKIILPIAGFLLLLEGLAQFYRNLMTAITGRSYEH
jgi:TRAP-type mannitol/chloroaromatic compound transport system permease small subunit